jgi:4-hydroxyphenylpyruvate dioxygenase-like putative hemolysin
MITIRSEDGDEAAELLADDEMVTSAAQLPPVSYARIDHIAIAVKDLESAIGLFRDTLGFCLVRRRTIRGAATGMISAEMEHGDLKFVLCQGTEPGSQVSRLIAEYGTGVAHIAIGVADVKNTVVALRRQGLDFDTDVIEGPGLTQAFSSRDTNSGLSFEFITRHGEEGFQDSNIQQLFDQLEQSGKY